jgi:RsiW-degrading membrane proteinase PrsW (M82 family)
VTFAGVGKPSSTLRFRGILNGIRGSLSRAPPQLPLYSSVEMNVLVTLSPIIGTAAVAPALLVLWLVIATDERPVPPILVWAAFLLGAASISLLGLARAPFAHILTISDSPWTSLALRSIFGVAAPEELVKILVIAAISARRRPFADPMDTVVYGAAVGLGFAAYENIVYLSAYPEMWRSLALLRSVLTVPFHGALGIIAGAYIAIARSGGALGAHRRDKDWARIRTWGLILLAPIGLHASFDFPLLALKQNPDASDTMRLILESSGMLIGFGTITLAARLVWRIGAHHTPRTEPSRAKLRYLRSMWGLLVVGGGAGFAGAVFVLTSIHHWLANPEKNIAIILVPVGFVSIAIGIALLLLATAIYYLGRGRLQRADSNLPFASSQG